MHAHGAPAPEGPLSDTKPRAFRRGFVQSLPFLLVLAPFGMLFGVAAQTSGLDLLQTMGFSVLVLAGASQFTAVELLNQNAPVVLVLASSLAVNLRMAMYSASLVPYYGKAPAWQRALIAYLLVDQNYAVSMAHAERYPALTTPQRVAFFLGAATAMCPFWVLFTFLGATLGDLIPPGFPLDFAIPITFLSMIAPMLRTLAHVAAAVTSVIAALALAWMPSGSGMLIAAALGMIAGALVETATIARTIRSRG